MKKIISTLVLCSLCMLVYATDPVKEPVGETKPKKLKFTTKNIHISTQCMIAGTALTAASIISMATNNKGHEWNGPGIANHVTPDRLALGIGLSIFSYGIIIRF